MTATALKNREISSKEEIAKKDREHKSQENRLDRVEKAKDRRSREKQAWIKGGMSAAGSLGGKIISAINDPAWYKSYIKDLSTFVNIPTYDRLGSPKFQWRYRYGNLTSAAVPTNNLTVPGIMIIPWVPVAGPQNLSSSNHAANPINQTLARTKEKVLALNSRSSVNWEASDLGYNIYCSADIASLILDLGRACKVYQTYHASNQYLAKTLLEALGWNWANFQTSFAEFRKLYVRLARKFNSAIVAPADMSIYARRMFLAGNIFCDSHDSKYPRQVYAYRQDACFVLSNTGDVADYTEITSTIRSTWSQFEGFVQQMFTRITDNPDFVEMYQDLRHAFGNRIIQLPESVDGEEITFNVDELNRLQIHNLKTIPVVYNGSNRISHSIVTADWSLRQDTAGYLYQGAATGSLPVKSRCVKYASSALGSTWINNLNPWLAEDIGYELYNVFDESCSGDAILDITRWTPHFSASYAVDTAQFQLSIVGTELALPFEVVSLPDTGGTVAKSYIGTTQYMGNCDSAVDMRIMVDDAAALFPFDWSPIVHFYMYGDTYGYPYIETYLEAHTTFTITAPDINRIHEACVMSELYVPDLGFSR